MPMDEIYVYTIPLPYGVHDVVLPCADGYTIYISDRLDKDHAQRAYNHAMWHIKNNDFEKTNLQEIEAEAHRKCPL